MSPQPGLHPSPAPPPKGVSASPDGMTNRGGKRCCEDVSGRFRHQWPADVPAKPGACLHRRGARNAWTRKDITPRWPVGAWYRTTNSSTSDRLLKNLCTGRWTGPQCVAQAPGMRTFWEETGSLLTFSPCNLPVDHREQRYPRGTPLNREPDPRQRTPRPCCVAHRQRPCRCIACHLRPRP
jgi:hypothetical protein